MKKSEFEQQITLQKLQHELALERAREEHAHRIQRMRVLGEELRSTFSHARDSLMPMYEHLGSEQSYALLKGQIEQGVALLTHLGERALVVAEKKIEVDGAARLSRNIEDGMKTLLQEVHRIYWAGRDDADADADADDAAFAQVARDLGYIHPNGSEDEDEDNDIVS